MGEGLFDIFVICGSINGYGIARAAVCQGYLVVRADMNDFASGTRSGSTKVIHGGLCYLEHPEFRLVRERLMEREVLWAMVPHTSWSTRFVLHLKKDAAGRHLKLFLGKAFEYADGCVDGAQMVVLNAQDASERRVVQVLSRVYFFHATSEYFADSKTSADVDWSYYGVEPLQEGRGRPRLRTPQKIMCSSGTRHPKGLCLSGEWTAKLKTFIAGVTAH